MYTHFYDKTIYNLPQNGLIDILSFKQTTEKNQLHACAIAGSNSERSLHHSETVSTTEQTRSLPQLPPK